jgi:hypothetical protein
MPAHYDDFTVQMIVLGRRALGMGFLDLRAVVSAAQTGDWARC